MKILPDVLLGARVRSRALAQQWGLVAKVLAFLLPKSGKSLKDFLTEIKLLLSPPPSNVHITQAAFVFKQNDYV